MFSSSSSSVARNTSSSSATLRAIWEELSSLIKTVDGQHDRLAAAAADLEPQFAAKVESHKQFMSVIAAEHAELVRRYNARRAAPGPPPSPKEEDDFWTSLAENEELRRRTAEHIDATQLLMSFPAAKGFNYRLAAPGVHLALGDFWLASLTGRISLEAVPGRGAIWSPGSRSGTPPGILVRASPISLSLRIDDLGLRGDKIPATLRHIREIEVTAEVALEVPLAFMPKSRRLEGAGAGSAAAAAASSAPSGPAVNAITRYEWRVVEAPAGSGGGGSGGFRFEVTKLECRTRGTGIPVPSSLVKYLINQFVPEHVKAAVAAAVPPEVGMLLCLQSDHHVSLAAEVAITSLPLEVMTAPLENAHDVPPAAVPAARPSSAAPSAALSSHHAAARLALRAARAVGMTSAQARALVAAQAAASVAAGGSVSAIHIHTAHDLMRFVSRYHAGSLMRRTQAAAAAAAAGGGGVGAVRRGTAASAAMNGGPAAAAAAVDPVWARIVATFQRLVNEHQQMQMAAQLEQVAAVPDKQQQRALVARAHAHAKAAEISIAKLFSAGERLYAKPVRLHVKVTELLVRVHAETAVGLTKAVRVRLLREAQRRATSASQQKGAVGTAATTAAAARARTVVPVALVSAANAGGPKAAPAAAAAGGAHHHHHHAKLQPAGSVSTSSGGGSTAPTLSASSSTSLIPASASAAPSAAAAAASSSLSSQLELVQEWARDAASKLRIAHANLSRLSASLGGSLSGGARGRVAAALRQVQVECAPGVSLPVPMKEGFFPPGSLVTAMESSDEYSDSLGWPAARGSGGTTGEDAAGASMRGRGTYSVMLSWPRHLLARDDDAPHVPAAAAAAFSTSASDPSSSSSSGGGVAKGNSALAAASNRDAPSPVGDDTAARSLRTSSVSGASMAAGGDAAAAHTDATAATFVSHTAPPAIGPGDVEVLAALKLHRLWAGLRADEAALRAMLRKRENDVEQGVFGKAPPPLYCLEVGLRPTPALAAPASPASSTAAMPYSLSIAMPEWVRVVAEAVAVEASGDVPLLTQQIGAMMRQVWNAAAAAQLADADEAEEAEAAAAQLQHAQLVKLKQQSALLTGGHKSGGTTTGSASSAVPSILDDDDADEISAAIVASGEPASSALMVSVPSISSQLSIAGGPVPVAASVATSAPAPTNSSGFTPSSTAATPPPPAGPGSGDGGRGSSGSSSAAAVPPVLLRSSSIAAPIDSSVSAAIATATAASGGDVATASLLEAVDAALESNGKVSARSDSVVNESPIAMSMSRDRSGGGNSNNSGGGAVSPPSTPHGISDSSSGRGSYSQSSSPANGSHSSVAATGDSSEALLRQLSVSSGGGSGINLSSLRDTPGQQATGNTISNSSSNTAAAVSPTRSAAAVFNSSGAVAAVAPAAAAAALTAAAEHARRTSNFSISSSSGPPSTGASAALTSSAGTPTNASPAVSVSAIRGNAPPPGPSPASSAALSSSPSSSSSSTASAASTAALRRAELLDAKARRRAAAIAARNVASLAISSRVRKYLGAEDLEISVNVALSLVSLPAPPLVALADEDSVGPSSAGGAGSANVVETALLDIAGLEGEESAGKMGDGSGALKMRKVLSFVLSSKHSLQPDIAPPPPVPQHHHTAAAQLGSSNDASGSGAVPSAAASVQSSGDAKLSAASAAAATSSAINIAPSRGSIAENGAPPAATAAAASAAPVSVKPQGAPAAAPASTASRQAFPNAAIAQSYQAGTALASGAARPGQSSAVPTSAPAASAGEVKSKGVVPVSAPAITLNLQVALLTLLEDARFVRDALDNADQLHQAAV